LAERALGLLLRTEAGRRAIVQDAYLFAGKYGKELSRLVAANSELEDVWLRIWQLPSREGVALVPELRAEILANLKGLNEQDLFADLSMFQSDNDLADLETYEKILTPKRGELASEIKNVREYLRACGNPMTSANVTQGCQIAGMAEAAQRFVSRMQLQWLVRSFENQTVSPANFVKRLSEMNFEKLRTPALHEALLKAIDAGAAQGAVGEQICKGEYFPMFRIFAANDRVLGVHWVGLLTKRADEFFRVGDYDASLRLLDESFKAMPEPVESRIAFLNTIIYSESWNDRADIQKRFRDVVRRGVPARAWYDLSEEKLVGIFAILAGLTFIWMIYYFLYKHRLALEERNALEAEMTALAEREELRMLRAFFEIEAGEGETELTKSYRRKAKETHPDLYGGDTAKFQEVQDKYQRARELLGRRGTLTS